MNKSIWVKVALAVLVCFALTACGSTQIRVVEKQTYVVAEVDPVYLNDCEQLPPAEKKYFMALTPDEQVDVLTQALLKQYKYTRACSSDKKSIRELLEKQKKAVADRNAAEEARVKAVREGKNDGA